MMSHAAAVNTRDPASTLRTYYFVRAGVAAVWVAAAFTLGVSSPAIGAGLMVVYPAWDALANAFDARSNGGFRASPSQTLNVAVSLLATAGMIGALSFGINAMVAVFGVWAVLAGLFQLITGVSRWRTYGAQWLMILSGAQSVLAGVFFTLKAQGPAELSIATVAGYAGFGAFYFLVSALWLTFRKGRRSA